MLEINIAPSYITNGSDVLGVGTGKEFFSKKTTKYIYRLVV
jgi:hypothetical protein